MVLQSYTRNMPLPKVYQDPPTVKPGTEIFLLAFNDLNDERDASDERIYRIKGKDIREWCERNGFAGDLDFEAELTSHVRACDEVWVELERARLRRLRQDQNRGTKGGKTKQFRRQDAGVGQGHS